MNKTININLGGFFFHIDEIAFQKLKRYLDAIARSLSDDPQGKNEIISDIEARISELLSEKITDARQVVNEGDIAEIIKIMGEPEDYAEAEEGYANESYSYQRSSKGNSKKLFRDGDDKFLGGVASGIAHYFDVDTVWIRLAFILFAFSGFSIITYIILWIVIPEAATTAEKLQMEGEAVNIDNIEKKIREEFSNVSQTIKNSATEVSKKIKEGATDVSQKVNEGLKKGSKKTTSGLQDFLDTLGTILLTIFKILGKCIGVILMFVAAITLIFIVISAFSLGSLEIIGLENNILLPTNFYDSMLPHWLLIIAGLFLVGIPFLILFILGLRILSNNVKQFSKPTSLTLLGIWLAALLLVIFSAIEFATTKASYGHHLESKKLPFVAKDTIHLKMVTNHDFEYSNRYGGRNTKKIFYKGEIKKTYSNELYVNVKQSETDSAFLQIRKNSEGKSLIKAMKTASEIDYTFDIVNNELQLNTHFLSDYRNWHKDEEIYITLFIPNDVTVYFDKNTKEYLNSVQTTDNTYRRDMVKNFYTMTDEGLENNTEQ